MSLYICSFYSKDIKKEKYFILIRISFTCYVGKYLILKLEIIWFKCIILCKIKIYKIKSIIETDLDSNWFDIISKNLPSGI